ncbi:hypothetical protein CI109_105112 [Kwoniella shandongensis]|uniref:Autophagy-related protein 13 n=1 Tax=Kwoniella shandongensis TaxID=1734106 RepID=A0A5M6C329_9TREE|nr:uncharacterized protein CI109_001951 [Kwoniella shandongensis]KAA5529526.1 hypothetical protein CI109_001951 [Kwoniella shandongensis]
MSASPLRPLLHPSIQPSSTSTTTTRSTSGSATATPSLVSQPTVGERNLASSSASSSQIAGQTSRQDQVLYRFYLKTVGVLVEGRLTHYGGGGGKATTEKKKDKWFNLSLPEIDLHKSDLQIYRSISSYQPYSQPEASPSDPCAIPPLLVAFILDTSDIPNGQALLWNRNGGKVALDTGLLSAKGKGKEKETRSGIVLERWTLKAQLTPSDAPSSSQLAPHTAYRLGIVHFRALYSLIRLLPAYRLFRRLRRANNGLRMGIKLWGPEGFPNSSEGLAEAWEIMERGLVGLNTGLEELVTGEEVDPEECQRYDFPKLDLFGNEYTLSTDYRPEVDFHVEDMEAVLSEKFVDMDEDWFTPTVARRRSEEVRSVAEQDQARSIKKLVTPTSLQANTSPIPQRQQAPPAGSFASAGGGSYSATRPSGSRVASGTAGSLKRMHVGSVGTDRWGALAEDLPFASGSSDTRGQDPSSPSVGTPAAIVAARRLSGHSIQPFASASPSTSLLRSTPPQPQIGSPIPTSASRPGMGGSRASSVGRTSSFLSQSGRSFTHAQIANMYAGSASPPITGAMSGLHIPSSPPPGQSPVSPSSLSFTKQPVPRSISGRPFYMTPSGSSPFVPESLEREPSSLSSATGPPGPPHIIKRYSSSLSQRSGRPIGSPSGAAGQPGGAGSQGSSGDGSSLPGSLGQQGLFRRTSTRESGLRHSLEGPGSRIIAPDEDEIQAFLKTLDALPQPPSLAAQAVHASRSHLPSTSSSLSAPSASPSPSPLHTSTSASGSPGRLLTGRVPMTRAQLDDELKRMAGSFTVNSQAIGMESTPNSTRAPSSGSTNPSSIGLLSASRPSSSARRAPASESDQSQGSRPMYRRQTSGGPSPLGPGTKAGSPLSANPMQPLKSADEIARHTRRSEPPHLSAARSLPGPGAVQLNDDQQLPPLSQPLRIAAGGGGHEPSSITAGILSPQTTGGTSTTDSTRTSRRGPVLLRGGFGDQRTSLASSPSHSPSRDLTRGVGAAVGLGINSRNGGGGGTGGGDAQVGSVPLRGAGGVGDDEFSSPAGGVGGWKIGGVSTGAYGRRQSASNSLATANPSSSTTANANNTGSQRGNKGQRTAPSSLGRDGVDEVGLRTTNPAQRARSQGRVVSGTTREEERGTE